MAVMRKFNFSLLHFYRSMNESNQDFSVDLAINCIDLVKSLMKRGFEEAFSTCSEYFDYFSQLNFYWTLKLMFIAN